MTEVDEFKAVLRCAIAREPKKCQSKRQQMQVIQQHYEDIARLRRMMSVLLYHLEAGLKEDAWPADEVREMLWGGKENVLSIMTKLTQNILKIYPVEQEYIAKGGVEAEVGQGDDEVIIKRVMERIVEKRRQTIAASDSEDTV